MEGGSPGTSQEGEQCWEDKDCVFVISPSQGACDIRGSWQLCEMDGWMAGRWMGRTGGQGDTWMSRKMHRKMGEWMEGWLDRWMQNRQADG